MEEFLMLALESSLGLGSLISKSKRSSTQEDLLKQQEEQERMRGVQQAEKDQIKIAKTLDAQKSQESVSGLTGPSFGAISKTSFDAFLNDENNIAMNTKFRENALKIREDEVKKSRNASMFGTLANLGMEMFGTVRAFK